MRNTAARKLLRHVLARPEVGRANGHDVVTRQSYLVADHTQCLFLPRSSLGTYPRQLAIQNNSHSLRTFHTTSTVAKSKEQLKLRGNRKKQQQEAETATTRSNGDDADDEDDGPKHPQPSPSDPLDFADVASRTRRHDERFRDTLKKLRTGGRFNPDALGSLRVHPDRKKSPAVTYPLREVAQVIPRGGRTISVLAHEEAYVKPIMSAVQASDEFNQQPQRDPDNELELILKIEPEKKEDLLRRVKAMCHEWRDRVRSVRHRRDKLHTTWQRDGTLGPDMKRTADKELDKVIKAKMAEIDGAEKEALKAVEAKK